MHTNEINAITTVGKPSGNPRGEINPIWWIIGFRRRMKIVIVAIIESRVPKNEETRYYWLSIYTMLQENKHHPQRLKLRCHRH